MSPAFGMRAIFAFVRSIMRESGSASATTSSAISGSTIVCIRPPQPMSATRIFAPCAIRFASGAARRVPMLNMAAPAASFMQSLLFISVTASIR